ncbi:hypothetical protein [Runella sp.]|uniref:hypothetical protein n=1 Tax=Runella sp. TaxID=1960881 RepID=UPI003D127BEA
MKPDKFDEAIRRKLEGIQPGFQDEDWAKFKAFQTTHAPTPFIQRFGRSIMYSAASVAAAVMVFANVYQYKQNHRLDQQVTQLKTQLAQRENVPLRISTRVDTVYITKYISVDSQRPQPEAYAQTLPQSNESELSNDEIVAENDISVSEGLKNVGKIIRKNPNERISEAFERPTSGESETSSGTKEIKNPTGIANAAKNELSFPKEKTSDATSQKETAGKNPRAADSQTALAQQNNEVGTKNSAKSEQSGEEKGEIDATTGSVAANNVPTNQIEINTLEPNQLEDLEGLQPAEIRVNRYAYATMQSQSGANAATANAKTPPPPPSMSLKNIRLRAGAGLAIGDKYTGYNFMTSVLLGKYWSLDVGIGKAKLTGPQYFTEAIFKDQTGRPFQKWNKSNDGVRPPLMQPQAIDIKTEVSLIRLPLSLTYRWPIKDNFTLLFSGGTNINLSAQQCYRFYYKERYDEFKEEKGQFSVTPSTSNDIMLGVGVEKQWRSLAFQVEAYTAPYLQKPEYLTDNRNLGIRFKILYQFGKKQI